MEERNTNIADIAGISGNNKLRELVPIWEKAYLTLNEASAYFNIGTEKLRELSNDNDCPFVLWNGNKRLIKPKILEQTLDKEYSI